MVRETLEHRVVVHPGKHGLGFPDVSRDVFGENVQGAPLKTLLPFQNQEEVLKSTLPLGLSGGEFAVACQEETEGNSTPETQTNSGREEKPRVCLIPLKSDPSDWSMHHHVPLQLETQEGHFPRTLEAGKRRKILSRSRKVGYHCATLSLGEYQKGCMEGKT
ncbi:MAG: hypothetical protein ABDK94_07660 [Atribacterota bacterium]